MGVGIILELMILQSKGCSPERKGVSGVLTFDYSTVIASLSAVKKEDGQRGKDVSENGLGNVEDGFVLAQTGYGSASGQIDHMQLWYGGARSQTGISEEEEELYKKGKDVSDVSQMILTVPEAEETLKDIQYATASGAYHDVDVKTREKFSLWVMFNPALLGLFESMYRITGNVDYSKTV